MATEWAKGVKAFHRFLSRPEKNPTAPVHCSLPNPRNAGGKDAKKRSKRAIHLLLRLGVNKPWRTKRQTDIEPGEEKRGRLVPCLPWRMTSTTATMLGFFEVNGAAREASPVLTCDEIVFARHTGRA